jgi:hypothetical protein
MTKKAKNSERERSVLRKSIEAPICSDSLKIAPDFQGHCGVRFKRCLRRAIPKAPEIPKPEPLPKALQNLFVPKPQILSIPGITATAGKRYRVVLGGEIIGDQLTIDEALKLARGGEE